MAEEPKRRGGTNQDRYNRINALINNANASANAVLTRPGVAKNLLDQAFDLLQTIGAFQGLVGNLWGQITQQQQGPSLAARADWDTLDEQLAEISAAGRQLNIAANDDLQLFQGAREQVQVDKDEFKLARDFHRVRSNVGLFLIAITMAVGGVLIFELFTDSGVGRHAAPVAPATQVLAGQVAGPASPVPVEERVAKIALLFGGRVAILLGLAYLLRFLFRFHSNHSAQAVSYQDRLAGLGTAELVLQSGSSATRQEVVRMMSETYLSLKENAFRETSGKSAEEPTPGMSEVEKIFEMLGKLLKLMK